MPKAFRAAHDRGLAHFIATGEGPVLGRRIEVTALNRAGDEFPIELSMSPTDQFGDLLFIGFMRDISERRAEAERQQRILQESEHRVKNMLTIVAAIAQQTAKSASDIAGFQAAFSGRLELLARAHELLVGQVWHDVSLTALAERVLGDEVAGGRARFGGPEVLLDPGKVLGLSMILHELFTNAVKYGALCNDEGELRARLDPRGRRCRDPLGRNRPAVRVGRAEQRLRPPDDRDERQVGPQGHDRARLAARRPDRGDPLSARSARPSAAPAWPCPSRRAPWTRRGRATRRRRGW